MNGPWCEQVPDRDPEPPDDDVTWGEWDEPVGYEYEPDEE